MCVHGQTCCPCPSLPCFPWPNIFYSSASTVPHARVPPSLCLCQALLEALRVWDFAPEALSDGGAVDSDLLALTMAPVRADLAMREQFCADACAAAAAGRPARPRLAIPLHVFGGTSERSFASGSLAAWHAFAPAPELAAPPTEPSSLDDPFDPSASFTCTLFPGGHFYLDEHAGRSAALERLGAVLRASISSLRPSVVSGPPLPPMASLTYSHEMVEACALATPHAIALVDANSERTYEQVVADATLVGAWLVSKGAAPRSAAALLMQHCAEFLIAQIGIAMSGAACFGLETHFGPQMLSDLMADTRPLAAITSPRHAPQLAAALSPEMGLLEMSHDGAWRALAQSAAEQVPPRSAWVRAAPYDTGLITMTSGTSGKPKSIACPTISLAVAVRARELTLPYATPEELAARGDTQEIEAFNVMFVWEAIRPLCYGHVALVIPDEVIVDTAQLATFLGERRVTRVLSTPSLLATILDTAQETPPTSSDAPASLSANLSRLQTWLLCGEVVPAGLIHRAARALPDVALINDYSSWEGSDVSIAKLDASGILGHKCAPVGQLLQGVRCALLHPTTGEPVPWGTVGELFVASPMAFTAYIGAAALTADRLKPMPAAMRALCGIDEDGTGLELARMHAAEARRVADEALATAEGAHATPPIDLDDDGGAALQPLAYRTGDLARLLPNGELAILGRADSTIKIRGFKVGIPYVESTIGALTGVGRVVVVPLLDEATGQPTALVAHLLPDASAAAAAAADERAWLHSVRDQAKRELAAHSLPSHWMLTRELAISDGESRKLDRKKLPKPKVSKGAGGAPRPTAARRSMGRSGSPADEMEAAIGPIWAEILDLEEGAFDRSDSFFDLGGHSLLASKLVAALNSRLSGQLGGRTITVLDLFDAPSLELLSSALAPKDLVPASLAPARPLDGAPFDDAARVDLALIGAAGRFPGAPGVAELWEMLKAGQDALRLFSQAELLAKGVAAEVRYHPDFVPAAYLVEGAQFFDAGFWGISPVEARLMDPQHRMFMEVAWAAFENAGYAPRSGTPAKTAVFASSGIDGYLVHHLEGEPLKDVLSPGDIFLAEVGSEKDYIATRVSYALDLMGPSLAVNSACSSALSSIGLACSSLISRQSDMAVAGGSALTFPGTGYLFEQGLVNSIDGKVRPFDAKAHGTVFGDAVGAVVLKRLRDATADDDNILCVIRGTGITNDGARKAGYAAPGVAGQAAAVTAALEAAGVHPSEMGYVECHATGTLVGDGIELRALTEAYAAMGSPPGGGSTAHNYCAVGSIKGNIGHANAAAGVTGLIKAALCLSTKLFVPTAHFDTLNEKVVLENGPFYVHTGGTAHWPARADGTPRLAGVSSFGIGGANVHMVLQEPPALPAPKAAHEAEAIAPCDRAAHVLTLSAKTAASLSRMATELADWFAAALSSADGGDTASTPSAFASSTSLPSLGRVAHTLHLGREAYAHRGTVVASTHHAALEALRVVADDASEEAAAGGLGSARKAPSVFFIFPGQGSQCPRMGEGLYHGEPIYRRHVDRMCEALLPLLGFDLRAKLFPSGSDTDAAYLAEFNAPMVTQPAIFVTELALGYTLVDLGVTPSAMAGHSIGEFVAATLAGVFSEADALELIATRARLSANEAPEGKMLSVSIDEATAAEVAATEPDKLWVAVQNAAGRQVIAGEASAIDRAAAALLQRGVKSRPLPVNRAYHTPLMSGVQSALARLLERMQLSAPSVPLCCNGTGGWLEPATAMDAQYWAAHVASAVRWSDNMEALAARTKPAPAPPTLVLELGSGSTLAPLLAECTHANADQLRPISTLRHPKVAYAGGRADQEVFGEAVGTMWESGASVSWSAYHASERYIKLPLPTYSFERDVHWANEDASMYVPSSTEALEEARAAVEKEEKERAAAAEAAAATGDPSNDPELLEPTLVRLRGAASAERRWVSAYCLAYAGGSTAAFAELARAAPEWMEVVGIEMPGKGELADAKWPADQEEPAAAAARDSSPMGKRRMGESGQQRIGAEAAALKSSVEAESAMMARLADRLAADAAGSALVLVGWSMGGMLAAELALLLAARGCPPQMLHVAGRMAPGSFIAAGDDVDKYLLASDEMKATEAWRDWLLPMLMADLRADARAEQRVAAAWSDAVSQSPTGAPPLNCLLQVCAGHEDAAFPPDAVQAWRPLTSGRFESHVLPGGHDILQRMAVDLLRLVSRALLPSAPLYAVEWRPTGAVADGEGPGEAPKQRLDSAPLTWRKLTGNLLDSAAPTAAPTGSGLAGSAGSPGHLPPNTSVASLASFASANSLAEMSADDEPAKEALDEADPEALALDAGLKSALGLVLYVTPEESIAAQEAQCFELIHMVQGFIRRGAAGRLVLVLPVSTSCGALVAGVSKVVTLESPELLVQRVYVPPAMDILRSGGPMANIAHVASGWLRWVASVASRHLDEVDLWISPSPPHALLAPRLSPQRELPPSSTPAVDPEGTYLITGGSGGVGGALVAWLLYEQGVPPQNIVLISRRKIQPPHDPRVRCVSADLSSPASLSACADLCALAGVSGIFHLAGVLDDGLLVNMTPARLHTAVQPKAGVLSLLALCAERRWAPRWLVAASSTSSLLGYAGQSNYCAANGLLDHLATFGLPLLRAAGTAGDPGGSSSEVVPRRVPPIPTEQAPPPPRVLTLNFGPWGEVGMAREGTKAHQLSLQSGELPMASSAAIGCIAEALRQLRASTAAVELGGEPHFASTPASERLSTPFGSGGMQFAVADVEWWRSPWPSHPLLQGVMHRLPTRSDGDDDDDADADVDDALDRAKSKTKRGGTASKAQQGDQSKSGEGEGNMGNGSERVEEFLKGRLSVWQPALSLTELGLDSLDLVSLRNAFQKKFKLNVPMATFTNAQQTLEDLIAKLGTKF